MSRFQIDKSKFHRQKILFIISIFIIILLEIKFFHITVIKHKELNVSSEANSLRKVYYNAPRGIIYDRNSKPIVDNMPTYDLKFTPSSIVSEKFNYNLLSNLINIDKDSLREIIIDSKSKFKKFVPVLLKRHVQFEDMSRIEEYKLDFPGLFFSDFPARTYPSNIKATHILGYLREVPDNVLSSDLCNHKYKLGDIYGETGIEKIYECNLKGNDGLEYHLHDVQGLNHGVYDPKKNIKTINGENLVLTIDARLQEYAESLMENKNGSIVAMDPLSGEILAMVSFPDYNLKSFTGPIPSKLWNSWNSDANNPMMNRSIQGLYPPGSVLKLIIASYALDNNIISKDWTVDCKGIYDFYGETYSCWNKEGHGPTNLVESIRHSCNIYYFDLIKNINIDDWSSIVKLFGFNSKTNIDLPSEAKGLIPDREYMVKRYGRHGWAQGHLLNFVIGQGDVLATPIQVLQMVNLIATSGRTFEPHLKLGKELVPFSLSLKKGTWDIINKSMWQVVNYSGGTGWRAKRNNNKVWGKTGTSQNPHGEDHSWFAGYTKLESDELMSLAIIVENGGKGSGVGSIIAGKLFDYYREISLND